MSIYECFISSVGQNICLLTMVSLVRTQYETFGLIPHTNRYAVITILYIPGMGSPTGTSCSINNDPVCRPGDCNCFGTYGLSTVECGSP